MPAPRNLDHVLDAPGVPASPAVAALGRRVLAELRRAAERVLGRPDLLTAGGVLVGIGLLVREYLVDRQFRTDEAMLALNLIERSPGQLLETLDFNQAAPPGFLLASDLVARILGYSAEALRLLPFLAGLVALLLFPRLATVFLSRRLVPAAVALLAVSGSLIFLDTNFKQYSFDVGATIGLYLLVLAAERGGTRPAVVAGLAGPVLIFFSHAALFAAAALGAVFVIRAVIRRERSRIRPLLLTLGPWLAAALALVLFTLPRVSGLRESVGGTASGSAAGGGQGGDVFEKLGLHSLDVYGGALAGLFALPHTGPGSVATKLVALVVLIGAVSLLKRAPAAAAALLLPIPMTYVASVLDLYAAFVRTLLFVLPALIICAVAGVETLARRRRVVGGVIAGGALALIAAFPLAATARHLVSPGAGAPVRYVEAPGVGEKIKPAVQYIRANWRTGDVLYVHYSAQYTFFYYLSCGCLDVTRPGPDPRPLWRGAPGPRGSDQFAPAFTPLGSNLRLGAYEHRDWAAYLRELDRLPSGRTWILYAGYQNPTERAFLEGDFVAHLDARGKRLAEFAAGSTRVFLYDFGPLGSDRRDSRQG